MLLMKIYLGKLEMGVIFLETVEILFRKTMLKKKKDYSDEYKKALLKEKKRIFYT